MIRYLFVYGTLRPAIAKPWMKSLLDRMKPLGPGRVVGRLFDLGPYPGAVLDVNAGSAVVGELLELPDDDSLLAALDEYEGFLPEDLGLSLFLREKCMVDTGLQNIEAWIYVFNGDTKTATIITDGDYLDAIKRKENSGESRKDND